MQNYGDGDAILETAFLYCQAVYMIVAQEIIALLVRLMWYNVQEALLARRLVWRMRRVRVSALQVLDFVIAKYNYICMH